MATGLPTQGADRRLLALLGTLAALALGLTVERVRRRRRLARLASELGARRERRRYRLRRGGLALELVYRRGCRLRVVSFASLFTVRVRPNRNEAGTGTALFGRRHHVVTHDPDRVSEFFLEPELRSATERLFAIGCTELEMGPWGMEIGLGGGAPDPLARRVSKALPAIEILCSRLHEAVTPARPPAKNRLLTPAEMAMASILPFIDWGLYRLGGQVIRPVDVWRLSLGCGLLVMVPIAAVWIRQSQRQRTEPFARLVGNFVTTVALLSLSYPLVVALNRVLDRKTPDSRESLIVDKKQVISRSGTRYWIRFHPAAESSTEVTQEVSADEYAAIVPGRSRLQYLAHPGGLGMPWWSGDEIHFIDDKPISRNGSGPRTVAQ